MHGKLWVTSFFLLFFSLFSLPAFAQCVWVKDYEESYVNCDGTIYKVFEIDESRDIMKKVSNYPDLELKIKKLEDKVELQEKNLKSKDDRILLLQDSLNMDHELIAKMFNSPYVKQKFFDRPAVNFAVGFFTSAATFFLWEYARK